MEALGSPLAVGQQVRARQTVGGIASAFSSVVIVVARPPAPMIYTPLVDGSTTVGGTGIAGASVNVFLDTLAAGTTSVGGDGTWTLALGAALIASQSATATQVVGGIQSAFSAATRVVARPPAPSVNGPLIDGTTSVTGTGIADATLELFVGNTAAGTGSVSGTGPGRSRLVAR